MSEIKLDRPLYLAEDQKTIVEEGDPSAAFVLGGKGSTIKGPERYGLRAGEDGVVVYGDAPIEEPAKKAIPAPPQDKAIKAPKETK